MKFRIRLEEHELPTISRHSGPLFHRWLPDGERDAIPLDTTDPSARLRIWFDRFGFVDTNGFIEFDSKRTEVDPAIVLRQAVLEGGPLLGVLEVQQLTEEELKIVKANQIGDPLYEALGKRIIKKLLIPQLINFINILRVNCGQYWIRELKEWDSTKESLGHYCKSLDLKWSLDDGQTWTDFVPNKPIATLAMTIIVGNGRRFGEYLTQEDWRALAKTTKDGYEPSLAASLLMRAHQFANEANYKYALIEGVTALEIALREYVRRTLDVSLVKSMSAFWDLPLKFQAVASATFAGGPVLLELERTVSAIEMRNKVVHEGWDPSDAAKGNVAALLRAVAALLAGPNFKFPQANPGNMLAPPEDWDKSTPKP